MDFYTRYLLEPALRKAALRKAYGFRGAITVSPGDWELWAAILFRERKSRNRYGHDLMHAEVKSAGLGANFEYQYHRNGGLEKLDAEASVAHIYMEHSDSLRNIDVRVVAGEDLRGLFAGWRPGLIENYAAGEKQRYRKNIPASTVHRLGTLVLQIRNGKLTQASERPVAELLQPPEPQPAS